MEHEADLFGPTGTMPSDADEQLDQAFEPGAFFHAPAPHRNGDSQVEPALPSEFSDLYMEGQQDERRRMGRELHDSTSQLLLALRLSVAHLRQLQGSGNADEILSEIDDTAREIDQELRTFTFLNYPIELGKCGLVAALDSLIKGFGKRTGLRIAFDSRCLRPCSGHLAVALLRVAQEALMNVHRHARATSVRVTLFERDAVLELSIRDDGRGMPPADHHAVVGGVGLQGMRNRIERLGGRFVIRRLKQGTKLVFSLPRMHPAKASEA